MCDRSSFRALLLAAGLGAACASAAAQAATDPLPATASVVASTGAAPPTQSTFTIAGPEDLTITLTDLAQPQALTALNVAITQGGTLAASYTLSTQTPTTTLAGANGSYTIAVFGVPNAGSGAGTFSVCVAPSSAPANCLLPGAASLDGNVASFAGSISAPSAAANAALSTNTFTLVVPAPGGSYTFNYADLAFPVALSSSNTLQPNPSLGLFSGSTPVTGGLGFASGTSFSLSPGTYTLLAVGLADATAQVGSYGLTVSGPAGTLLNVTVPVGQLGAPTAVVNPAQQSLTLAVTDYAFPGALTQARAMLTAGGAELLSTSAAGGPVTSSIGAGTLQLWTYAAPGATAGTYSVDVAAGTTDLMLSAYGVAQSTSNYAYAFVTPALTANTAYQAAAVDLQFPSTLSALSFAVAVDGAVTPQSGGGPSISFTPAKAESAAVLVAASTPASGAITGNGLFDVNVQTAANSPQLVFDQTQAVSSTPGFFSTQALTIGSAGNYGATLTDQMFPAPFSNLALAVTQGSLIVGKIFGGGTFSFTATPGTYQLTFTATPASAQEFGLYTVGVTYGAPSVTLTSSASSTNTGSSVTLNWTVANATACTASGGAFTGSIAPANGSQSVVVSATTTYMLQCSGPAGTDSATTTVTATPASSGGSGSSSGGGGGALDLTALAFWGLAAAAAVCRRRRGAPVRARA
jgi:hypothetical protein